MVNALYNLSSSVIAHYFTRRRDLANTIMVLGSSFNLLVIPNLLSYFHAEYGFRGAILITGGLSLNLIPAGMVFHPVEWHIKRTAHAAKTPESEEARRTSKLNFLRAFVDASKANILLIKSPRVIIISISYSIFFAGTSFVSSYIPFEMQATGYTLEEAAYCITMMGIFHFVARFIHPFVPGACGGKSFMIIMASYVTIPVSVVGKMIYLILLVYVTDPSQFCTRRQLYTYCYAAKCHRRGTYRHDGALPVCH